jgi:hypothetical protein
MATEPQAQRARNNSTISISQTASRHVWAAVARTADWLQLSTRVQRLAAFQIGEPEGKKCRQQAWRLTVGVPQRDIMPRRHWDDGTAAVGYIELNTVLQAGELALLLNGDLAWRGVQSQTHVTESGTEVTRVKVRRGS